MINDIPVVLADSLATLEQVDKDAVEEWLKTHSDVDVLVALWEAIDPTGFYATVYDLEHESRKHSKSTNVYSRREHRSA